MARVRVTSEIGPLRAVLVHTPGRELVAVTPANREEYLYDDIVDLELAQREHRHFVAVLERFAEVYEVRALLTELAGRPDVREFLVTRALEWCRPAPWPSRLARPPPRAPAAPWAGGPGGREGPLAPAPTGPGSASR